jgi:hypothetical protein
VNPSRDPLSELLASWQIKPPADPNFRPAVAARLAAARRKRDWPSLLHEHPAVWTAAAVIVLGAAAWTGHEAGRVRNQADRDRLADAYVRQLDPRALAGQRP